MFTYNLTDEQKNLLCLVVYAIRKEGQDNSFLVSLDMQGAEIIGIDQRFSHGIQDNLIALADADLVTVRRVGEFALRFSVKQSGFNAVDNSFESPSLPGDANITIGALIYGGVSGGNIQAVGFASQTELEQIVNDPEQLNRHVEEYMEKLIDSVKGELSSKNLRDYLDATEELKSEIRTMHPEPSRLKSVTRTLAFLGDIEGTISLVNRAWPYIYPLLMICSQMLK